MADNQLSAWFTIPYGWKKCDAIVLSVVALYADKRVNYSLLLVLAALCCSLLICCCAMCGDDDCAKKWQQSQTAADGSLLAGIIAEVFRMFWTKHLIKL